MEDFTTHAIFFGRIWRDYPDTDWGERTFVLLVDQGWTSCTRARKEPINSGELFARANPFCGNGPVVLNEELPPFSKPRRILVVLEQRN